MIVVSDTSPITTLLQIGRADVLKHLYGEVLVPEAVRDELSVLHQFLPSFFKISVVKNKQEVERLLADLDPGEAEGIILAKELHAEDAKEAGLISSVRNVIEELQTKTTFHLSAAMKARTLQIAGEL